MPDRTRGGCYRRRLITSDPIPLWVVTVNGRREPARLYLRINIPPESGQYLQSTDDQVNTLFAIEMANRQLHPGELAEGLHPAMISTVGAFRSRRCCEFGQELVYQCLVERAIDSGMTTSML
jgi:hypothetical protein